MTAAAPRPVSPTAGFEAALGDREFERLQRLIEQEAGIHLGPAKRALVVGRLGKRLRDLGLASFRQYCELVERDPAERVQMLDRISTNETHFFREPRHFELLQRELLPRWEREAGEGLRPRRLKVWSAACSTGEEPFTLAMVLLRAFPPGSGWELDILASDISTRVLRRAEDATWPVDKADEIPEADLKRFMLRGVGPQEGVMRASPELRDIIRFARINLMEEPAGLGAMDLVFCRNVLIYFSRALQLEVVRRLADVLSPDGYLFLGHSESLPARELSLEQIAPTVYRRRPSGQPQVHRP